VWLALTFSAHPHHKAAVEWFDEALPESCGFCRMTQQGFLRLSSNPKAFKIDALTMSAAWHAFDQLLGDERSCFVTEAPGVGDEWRALTSDDTFSAKIWNDAYLAAFAKMGGLQLVTFDKGFKRYPGLKLKVLGLGK
jgi:toxin-antitoxin system PIN domain toxin